jgi:hypothetical protein
MRAVVDFKKVFMVVLPFVIVFPAAIQPKFCGIRKFIIKNIAIGKSEISGFEFPKTQMGTAHGRPREVLVRAIA